MVGVVCKNNFQLVVTGLSSDELVKRTDMIGYPQLLEAGARHDMNRLPSSLSEIVKSVESRGEHVEYHYSYSARSSFCSFCSLDLCRPIVVSFVLILSVSFAGGGALTLVISRSE